MGKRIVRSRVPRVAARGGSAHGAAASRRVRMLAVLRQFRVILGALRRHYASVERSAGIGGAQLWALAQIGEAGELRVGELAQGMGIHSSTASNLVRQLLEQGFVRKLRAYGDQRIVCLSLSAAGRRVLARAPRPVEGLLQAALVKLPAKALDRLHEDLHALIGRMAGEHVGDAAGVLLTDMVRSSPRSRPR
jgi:DNA-binding MarR family transcriptional regulator